MKEVKTREWVEKETRRLAGLNYSNRPNFFEHSKYLKNKSNLFELRIFVRIMWLTFLTIHILDSFNPLSHDDTCIAIHVCGTCPTMILMQILYLSDLFRSHVSIICFNNIFLSAIHTSFKGGDHCNSLKSKGVFEIFFQQNNASKSMYCLVYLICIY